MPKIPIPTTDESIDTSDPTGAAMDVLLLALGFAVVIVAAVGGQWLYNQVAGVTPDEVGTVEVL